MLTPIPDPDSMEQRRCVICQEPFNPKVAWQKICSKLPCYERREVQRVAQAAFLRRITERCGAGISTIRRVWDRQEGICPWCRTPIASSPTSGVPRARWVAFTPAKGVFLCYTCDRRIQRLQRAFVVRKKLPISEAIDRVIGFMESVDAIWGDMRGSTRAAAKTRRRAKFTSRAEAAPINADADGAGLGQIDS